MGRRAADGKNIGKADSGELKGESRGIKRIWGKRKLKKVLIRWGPGEGG